MNCPPKKTVAVVESRCRKAVVERWPLAQVSTVNFFTQEFNLVLLCKLITTETLTVFCLMCLQSHATLLLILAKFRG